MTRAGKILERLGNVRGLIAGDICLDRWCTYDPALSERSRETGIPRIAVVKTEVTPGAGGTIANNTAALGIRQLQVLGATGDDGFAYELRSALTARGIGSDLLVRSQDMATFTYTKLLNSETGDEDQPRVDFVFTEPLPRSVEDQILERLHQASKDIDVLWVSDQAETAQGGCVSPRVRDALTTVAAARPGLVIWVDSRMRPEHFRGVILKPNQSEAAAACSRLTLAGPAALRAHTNAPLLFVTHGGKGAEVITASGSEWIETREVANPLDICGAGDSFSAGAAAALATGSPPGEAVWFGNLVASITIMKKGTGTASPEEILRAEAAL